MSFASVESRIVSTAMASGVESRGEIFRRPRGLDTSRYPDAGQMAETTRLEYDRREMERTWRMEGSGVERSGNREASHFV